jgi:SAM-dependent methyltransferase
LAVAKASATTLTEAAAPIEWMEASALAMPMSDASFDTSFCLEGLQFFPDLVAGLAEIRRVLVPGGKLFASCWAALVDNPGYDAISEGLRAYCSPAAAWLPPFSLADPNKITPAVQAAGFSNVAIVRQELTLTAPSAREFVNWIAAGGPTMRHSIAQVPDDRREDFFRFIEQFLASFATAGEPLRLPSARNILSATR